MALSVVVFVGESKNWIPEIAAKAKSLTLGHGKENVDISPLCYTDVYYNINKLVKKSCGWNP
jgi:malonate-semialdehyde dehydrogenase (acetylating)/methylmalonate-semialdehyde dehydrogenase